MEIYMYKGEAIKIKIDLENKKVATYSDWEYWKDTKREYNNLLRKEIGLEYNSKSIRWIDEFEDVILANWDKVIKALESKLEYYSSRWI